MVIETQHTRRTDEASLLQEAQQGVHRIGPQGQAHSLTDPCSATAVAAGQELLSTQLIVHRTGAEPNQCAVCGGPAQRMTP